MFASKQKKSAFATLASDAARVRNALLCAGLCAVFTAVLLKPLGPAAPLFVFFMVLAGHLRKSPKPKQLTKNFWGVTETPPADASQAKTFHARAQLQVALDQAAQAESAAGRANYGDKYSRMAAAEQASYNAIAAREAASRASASAAGGATEASEAAAQAYQAACRAQAAADRARYSASTAR